MVASDGSGGFWRQSAGCRIEGKVFVGKLALRGTAKVKVPFLAIVVCLLLALSCLVACGGEESQAVSDDVLEVDDSSANVLYALIIGNDTRLGTVDIDQPSYADGNARSDVMMLARIDSETHKVTLISVPRDTETDYDGTPGKMNRAYQDGGPEAAVSVVEDLTGVSISYYLDVDFVQFENLIDALGGVTVDVPNAVTMKDIVSGRSVSLAEGTQELDGVEALALARVRKVYADDQDAIRQMTNRSIVEACIAKVAASPEITQAAVDALMANCDTNWPADDLADLVADFASHSSDMVVYKATGPYEGDINEQTGEWLAYRDEAAWAKVISLAEAGKDPSHVCGEPRIVLLDE